VGVRLRSWSCVRSQELEPCSTSRSAQGGHQQAVVQSRSIRLAEGLLVNRVGQVYSKSEQEAYMGDSRTSFEATHGGRCTPRASRRRRCS
jgi:hypothetical protein